jgi:hypothetical protein
MAREFSGATKPTSVENDEHLEVGGVGVKRVLSAGFDGSALQDLTVDAAGHLQVDVLTGGGGGTQYADGAAKGTATGNLAMGNDGTLIQALKCDADGVLAVSLPTATVSTLTPPAAITGFATSALQLADGHNVTVDNSTGAAAVNIQDGGNTITVDGTVSANATLSAETTKVIGTVNISAAQTIAAVTSITNAVTVNSHAVTNAGTFAVQSEPTVKTGFGQGKVDNADTTTARAITGAEAQASKYFYITSIILSAAAAGAYWIEDADAAQITCKFTLAANGGVSWTAGQGTPFKSTTVNKGLSVKGSAAGVVGCMITFYAAT